MKLNVSLFIYFRKKVEQVLLKLESFPGALITIESQDIQMKRAFDLLDLECELKL